MIRILVVDDSGFMRLALKKMLEKDPKCKVVGEARSADEAIQLAKKLRPNIITMDVEMPGGSGEEATAKIMQKSPAAIIMVSSLTNIGAEATFNALRNGAVDFIPKKSSFVNLDIASIEYELLRKVHYWFEHWQSDEEPKRIENRYDSGGCRQPPMVLKTSKPRLVVIGASTGGPKIIPEIFDKVRPIDIPIVIALHMPELYTESFAKNMALRTGHRVVEGRDGMVLQAATIIIAAGGKDTSIMVDNKGDFYIKVVEAQKEYSIHPSVNCLFLSALKASKKVASVILSGMGDDGFLGAEAFRRYNLPVVAQDKDSCLVYGMPRVVVEKGLATKCLNIDDIAEQINSWGKPQHHTGRPDSLFAF